MLPKECGVNELIFCLSCAESVACNVGLRFPLDCGKIAWRLVNERLYGRNKSRLTQGVKHSSKVCENAHAWQKTRQRINTVRLSCTIVCSDEYNLVTRVLGRITFACE